MRRVPLVSTLVVLLAVAVMISLGIWQLGRLREKEAALAEYRLAQQNPVVAEWPAAGADSQSARRALAYRQVRAVCAEVLRIEAGAGISARGESGWRHIAHCRMEQGYPQAEVVLGWSKAPEGPTWTGGEVQGTFVMTGQYDARIIASPPLAGLGSNARPDPADIPNNHLSYAIQWFLFAATALVIYALALRKRLAAPGPQG